MNNIKIYQENTWQNHPYENRENEGGMTQDRYVLSKSRWDALHASLLYNWNSTLEDSGGTIGNLFCTWSLTYGRLLYLSLSWIVFRTLWDEDWWEVEWVPVDFHRSNIIVLVHVRCWVSTMRPSWLIMTPVVFPVFIRFASKCFCWCG